MEEYVKELCDGAKNLVFYDCKDNEDLRCLSDFQDDFRKAKSLEYVFEVYYSLKDYIDASVGWHSSGTVICCFYEDTIPFTEEEVSRH